MPTVGQQPHLIHDCSQLAIGLTPKTSNKCLIANQMVNKMEKKKKKKKNTKANYLRPTGENNTTGLKTLERTLIQMNNFKF